MPEEAHFPGKTEEEFPAEEQLKAEEPTADTPQEEAPSPEKEGDTPKPDDKASEDEPSKEDTPEDEPKESPEPQLQKKRSIYDDLKDTRKELKQAQARIKELEEKPADEKPADAPAEPAGEKPADELQAFAKEHDIDATSLERLANIIAQRTPNAQLSQEERQQLADLKTWQESKLAEDARAAEDKEIRSQSATVKEQLDIHDDAELSAVMDEIVKLAHTERYHDKEVDYIVFREREALSKLISPKKPSFEQGAAPGENEAPTEVEFSGKMTPEGAQKAALSDTPKSALDVRGGK